MHADWNPVPTQLFLELCKQSLLKEADTLTLREALCNIRRFDLVTLLDDFFMAQLNKDVEQSLKELHQNFFHLVNSVEDSLKSNDISIDVLMRRFRMLPPPIRRQ